MNAPKALLPVYGRKISRNALVIDYKGKHRASRAYLKQWVPSDDGQKAFQAFSPGLDDFIGEPVCENLSWQWRNVDPGRLPFEDISKGFEIGITPTNDGMA